MGRKRAEYDDIPGTYVFDGRRASCAYGLNKMCMSFNSADNRAAFKGDPESYCARYGLTEEQVQAIRDRDFLRLLQLGGNIYYLAKLAGVYGAGVQDIGAQMTGMSLEEFKAMLLAGGNQAHG